jgi:hypothetical protein
MGAVVPDTTEEPVRGAPELITPVLRIIHRVINTHLVKQTGVKRAEAATGAITLIQRFGSAVNLNIHLHALMLDGVYQTGGEAGAPVFHQAAAPAASSHYKPCSKKSSKES